MSQKIVIILKGSLAPNNKVTARTLHHTLAPLQRAIDKTVLYQSNGSLRKYSTLPAEWYPRADFIVEPFEEGSIKVPLLNEAFEGIVETINHFIKAPYEEASLDQKIPPSNLLDQVDNMRSNIQYDNVERITHQDLIHDKKARERSYAQVSILGEFNTMISPLRSKSRADDDRIILQAEYNNFTLPYEFDALRSYNFGKLTTQKTLGRPTIYIGKLQGLVSSNNPKFPHVGDFCSDETGKVMKLHVPEGIRVRKLNSHNLDDQSFAIWAAPISVYGAFDEVRGDIVFLSFVE